MSTPRAVRIPRASSGTADATTDGEATVRRIVRTPTPAETFERRANRAGRQRAFRLTLIYLVALLALYLGFVALDRAAPGGTSATAETGILEFSLVAAVLAVAGLFVTLSPAPRAVELSPSRLVVEEWTGRRREFPPLGSLHVHVIRRYPAGFLSSEAVEAVQVSGPKVRRTYHLTEGMIPEGRPAPAAAAGSAAVSLE